MLPSLHDVLGANKVVDIISSDLLGAVTAASPWGRAVLRRRGSLGVRRGRLVGMRRGVGHDRCCSWSNEGQNLNLGQKTFKEGETEKERVQVVQSLCFLSLFLYLASRHFLFCLCGGHNEPGDDRSNPLSSFPASYTPIFLVLYLFDAVVYLFWFTKIQRPQLITVYSDWRDETTTRATPMTTRRLPRTKTMIQMM